jgi:AhpD family alkylhydroperoxidase
MTLRLKEKELVAVGVSVAAGCKPCTDYHVKAARKAKATDDDIRQAIADATEVCGYAQAIMTAHGLAHLGIAGEPVETGTSPETTRTTELVAIGAAFAVNCTASLERHLTGAGRFAITAEDVDSIVKLARFIKGKAASHVDKLVGLDETDEEATPEKTQGGFLKRAMSGVCGCC